MLTEQDFENAEAAIKTVDEAYKNNQLFAPSLSVAEKTLYEFAKKVLAEARRDFLTEAKATGDETLVFAAYPIESAPKDGTQVVAFLFGDDGIMRWASKARYGRDRGDRNSHWYDGMNERMIQPTHWIPTPKVKP